MQIMKCLVDNFAALIGVVGTIMGTILGWCLNSYGRIKIFLINDTVEEESSHETVMSVKLKICIINNKSKPVILRIDSTKLNYKKLNEQEIYLYDKDSQKEADYLPLCYRINTITIEPKSSKVMSCFSQKINKFKIENITLVYKINNHCYQKRIKLTPKF